MAAINAGATYHVQTTPVSRPAAAADRTVAPVARRPRLDCGAATCSWR